jgi:phage gp29-like protein
MPYPGVDLRTWFAPGKVLFYQPRVTGAEPNREGLARVLVWAALFRNWSVRDWVQLGELAWKPWRIGTYDGADEKAISTLKTILRCVSTLGILENLYASFPYKNIAHLFSCLHVVLHG